MATWEQDPCAPVVTAAATQRDGPLDSSTLEGAPAHCLAGRPGGTYMERPPRVHCQWHPTGVRLCARGAQAPATRQRVVGWILDMYGDRTGTTGRLLAHRMGAGRTVQAFAGDFYV